MIEAVVDPCREFVTCPSCGSIRWHEMSMEDDGREDDVFYEWWKCECDDCGTEFECCDVWPLVKRSHVMVRCEEVR